jgi:hypothetical protein
MKVVEYIEHQNEIGNTIEDKIGYTKRSSNGRNQFINGRKRLSIYRNVAYDFFANNEGKLIAFYETRFYEELMKFSKENQLFYGKIITDKNYILDSRCNKVCITKEKFSFYDHNGVKCIFTMRFTVGDVL